MGKQVRHAEYRLLLILSNGNLHGLSVFLYHHAVHGQGNGTPLVFADTAVIMGFKKCDILLFVQRIGL